MKAGAGERVAALPAGIEHSRSARVEHSPALAPEQPPIDLAHLADMTLGDRGLEAEVLGLFAQQSGMLIARMAGAAPKVIGALAHTLTGSARGVGAWKVAQAAETAERAAAHSDPHVLADAVENLSAAVREARTIIADPQRFRVQSELNRP